MAQDSRMVSWGFPARLPSGRREIPLGALLVNHLGPAFGGLPASAVLDRQAGILISTMKLASQLLQKAKFSRNGSWGFPPPDRSWSSMAGRRPTGRQRITSVGWAGNPSGGTKYCRFAIADFRCGSYSLDRKSKFDNLPLNSSSPPRSLPRPARRPSRQPSSV